MAKVSLVENSTENFLQKGILPIMRQLRTSPEIEGKEIVKQSTAMSSLIL